MAKITNKLGLPKQLVELVNSNYHQEETWKDIQDFEGKYQISDLGRVKSLYNDNGYKKTYREKILKYSIKKNGYCQVILVKNRKRYSKNIHRLVAQAFIPNPNNLPCVNHKNEIKSDNVVGNLEWCTISYNTRYSCGVKINQYSINNLFINSWNNIAEISDKLKISRTSINNCLNDRSKTAGGYIWRHADVNQ